MVSVYNGICALIALRVTHAEALYISYYFYIEFFLTLSLRVIVKKTFYAHTHTHKILRMCFIFLFQFSLSLFPSLFYFILSLFNYFLNLVPPFSLSPSRFSSYCLFLSLSLHPVSLSLHLSLSLLTLSPPPLLLVLFYARWFCSSLSALFR